MDGTDQYAGILHRFSWLGPGRVPASLDLRRCDWELSEREEPGEGCIGLIDAGDLDSAEWLQALTSYGPEARRFILVAGVRRAQERARVLRIGLGDAVTDVVDVEELAARAQRLLEAGGWLPRIRHFGPLKLDLLLRDGYGHGKPLNLNPREFALLWRLTDSPNRSVSKQTLLQDVWRIGFIPKTNSIAVHMSRLRRKLAFAGLEDLIDTGSAGYCLRMGGLSLDNCPARSRPAGRSAPHGPHGPHGPNGMSAPL